ncbi:hypothetical protein K3495_g4454 [Podosphaera aphanis]|nr:hypothetical protein K3495_g4454 [Podosphaera aphanis]
MSDEDKIWNLSVVINSTLQQYLVFKNLPDNDYLKWVTKVRRVAGCLESLPSYRPKGCSGTKTWNLPQNGILSSPMFDNQIPAPKLDADGDTKMGGVNAIKALQAAINALKFNSQSKDKSNPSVGLNWNCLHT